MVCAKTNTNSAKLPSIGGADEHNSAEGTQRAQQLPRPVPSRTALDENKTAVQSAHHTARQKPPHIALDDQAGSAPAQCMHKPARGPSTCEALRPQDYSLGRTEPARVDNLAVLGLDLDQAAPLEGHLQCLQLVECGAPQEYLRQAHLKTKRGEVCRLIAIWA